MRLHWLLIIGLLLQGPIAQAAPTLKPGFFPVHQSEPMLLHRQITPAELRALQVWDLHLMTWRAMQPADVPSEQAPLTVVHLWADWCKPCIEELSVLRDFMEELGKAYAGRVQIVLLSETSSPEAMRALFEKEQARMPRGPHYLDTGEAIAESLRVDLPTTLSYPVTLVLDSQHIVRHAIVGSIFNRRVELRTGIARLLRAAGVTATIPATP
jgi:thiol-disulfide isomerase/thioredoxin